MDQTSDQTSEPKTDQTEDLTSALTVAEAAEALGITTEAARMRVKRGTLPSTRVGGTVYVLIDRPNPEHDVPNAGLNDRPNSRLNGSTQGPNGGTNTRTDGRRDGGAGALLSAKDETIDELRDRVAQLSRIVETRDEEIRRRDHIIMALTERVPELEAPQRDQESTVRSAECAGGGKDQEEPERRSWWRRVLAKMFVERD